MKGSGSFEAWLLLYLGNRNQKLRVFVGFAGIVNIFLRVRNLVSKGSIFWDLTLFNTNSVQGFAGLRPKGSAMEKENKAS